MNELCCRCDFFEYEEIWDGENEVQIYVCLKEHYDHIDYNADGCENWRRKDG